MCINHAADTGDLVIETSFSTRNDKFNTVCEFILPLRQVMVKSTIYPHNVFIFSQRPFNKSDSRAHAQSGSVYCKAITTDINRFFHPPFSNSNKTIGSLNQTHLAIVVLLFRDKKPSRLKHIVSSEHVQQEPC